MGYKRKRAREKAIMRKRDRDQERGEGNRESVR